MARKRTIIGIVILGIIILVGGITLWGVKYDFILIPSVTWTPGITTTPPITDPEYDTVKPTITYVQADGETISKTSYTLIFESEVALIQFGVSDYFLIDRTNPINSVVRLEVFKKSDIDGTLSQSHVETWSGDSLIAQCSGILNMNYYMNAHFSSEIDIIPSFEYQVEITVTDSFSNTLSDGRWKLRLFQAPGQLDISSWTPRENRWIDFEVMLEKDETVKSLSAFFKNNAEEVMGTTEGTFYIDLTLDNDRWKFIWDTYDFPDDFYTIHFLCEYGDTGIVDEEYKYEKEYEGGITFQIFNTDNSESPTITAPGFGVAVGLIAISVIIMIIKIRIGDDDKIAIRKKTNP